MFQFIVISFTLFRAHSLLATPTQFRPTFSPLRSPHSLATLEESVEALKHSFSEYLDGNVTAAQDICNVNFSAAAFSSSLDTLCDLSVMQLSEMVLDDPPPTSDPRWNDGGEGGGASNSSLILIYRIEQKLQAHLRYVQFLSDVGLLERLTCVSVRGRPILTRLLLCEHAEKIQSAITLRKLHSQ